MGKKICDLTGEKRSTSYLFQSISIAIQRGNAASVMGTIKSLGKAEVFFIRVANSCFFFENPQKLHQKSQICKTPLTGGVAKTIHQNKK